MISYKLKLLAIDHNAERISDQQFAHQAFLLISDELTKAKKHRESKQDEQSHQVSQNVKECKDGIIIDKQTKLLNDAIEYRKRVEEESKRVIEKCREQSRYYKEQTQYYREMARQIKEKRNMQK